ncbi:MAG: SDR family NAD(P)-dependent oxidoreductase [Dehalococcoidales bacterium]|nr:SDR family NAD(P)-dependent oxidoreductase [Dehalococcoidales bacterium]
MGKLDGQVAIVTGASRGIGKAVAIEFAKQGAKVAIAARTVEQLKSGLPGTISETVDAIKAVGGKALAIKTNVMEESEVDAMVKKVLSEWGRIDILVNNAAAAAPGPFVDTTTKRFNLVIGVNLMGTFLCTKAVLPTMIKQKGGSIVNTSSGAADSRIYGVTGIAYGTAKAAVEHFTFAAAAELSKYNIAVNCYKPAAGVATEGFVFNLPADYDKSRLVGPEDMVKACLFLAQQRAKNGVTAAVGRDSEFIHWFNL